VFEKAKKITVKGINGDFTKTYVGNVLLEDKNNDLALIKLENFTGPTDTIPYNIRSVGVETGEAVSILGYPMTSLLGTEIKLNTGIVSSKSGFQGSISSFQVSAAAQPGNSGSPLFDEYGNLIGIINAKIVEGEAITYAIKIIYLNTLIEIGGVTSNVGNLVSSKEIKLQDMVKAYSKFVYIIEIER
jgi:S1-C subfamily serine protease